MAPPVVARSPAGRAVPPVQRLTPSGNVGAGDHTPAPAPPVTPPVPAPPPTPAPPPAPTPSTAPTLDDLEINAARGPTTGVATTASTVILAGGREVPVLDCHAVFIADVTVEPQHIGTIFFRQYVMSLTRKEDACARGPMGVDKGPALDSLGTYNHPAGEPGCSGAISVAGGHQGQVTMTDYDAPAQVVGLPLCVFNDGDRAALFAADRFRLVVMWAPANGQHQALGHREWAWSARAGFSKLGSTWTHGTSKGASGPTPGTTTRPGVEPSTNDLITSTTIMAGKGPVAAF
jgi:hypothetical protein